MEKQFTYGYHQWGANNKVMDIIDKREKSLVTLRLIGRQPEIVKHGNLRFKFDKIINRKVWVTRRPDERGRHEVVPIHLELLEIWFRNNKKNGWVGVYFERTELKAGSRAEQKITNTPEQNNKDTEPISSTRE